MERHVPELYGKVRATTHAELVQLLCHHGSCYLADMLSSVIDWESVSNLGL